MNGKPNCDKSKALKRNELLIHITTKVHLQEMILNEKANTENYILHYFSFVIFEMAIFKEWRTG